MSTDRARMQAYTTAGLSRVKRLPTFALWMRRGDDAIKEQEFIESGQEIFDQLEEITSAGEAS